ncbi:hypothetical protein [Thiolapillus sp.]|uniref:hypothetical protein n=1 Tax=Thiolapillus sp. TaxID=2017437 RepID=UPI003AF67BF8
MSKENMTQNPADEVLSFWRDFPYLDTPLTTEEVRAYQEDGLIDDDEEVRAAWVRQTHCPVSAKQFRRGMIDPSPRVRAAWANRFLEVMGNPEEKKDHLRTRAKQVVLAAVCLALGGGAMWLAAGASPLPQNNGERPLKIHAAPSDPPRPMTAPASVVPVPPPAYMRNHGAFDNSQYIYSSPYYSRPYSLPEASGIGMETMRHTYWRSR